jgi:hypothetical protein
MRDRGRITGQAAIAGGVLLALFVTGWLLGLMIAPDAGTVAATDGPAAVRSGLNGIPWLTVVGTTGLLLGVLLAVEALVGHARAQRGVRFS